MSKNPAISLRSRWLSERLKSARQVAGYSLIEAGEYLQVDHTTLGRFERGTHRIRRAYVKDLLDFYGVSDRRERDYLLQLAEEAWRKNWSDMDTTGLDSEFVDLTWLEAKATKINVFEPLLIHGLLQTPAYAEAATRAGIRADDLSEVATRTAEVRVSRQRILHGDDPTALTVVMEEIPLRRVIGSPKVMREQLNFLLEASRHEHIEILVVPVDLPWDPGHEGPFVHFEMPDPYPEIAYVENLAGRTFLEDESKVLRFRDAHHELRRLALSPKKSVKFIQDVLKDYE